MLIRDEAPGVHRLTHAAVNLYIVEDGDGVTLVDAGLPAMWPMLLHALEELGHPPTAVQAIALTHAHFDHVGFAAIAQRTLDVSVWVHDRDAFIAAHPYRYKPERNRFLYPLRYPRALPILATMVRAGALAVRGVRGTVPYSVGAGLPVPGHPTVLFTPGHTEGHCALHFPDRDTIITGDALVTLDPYTARTGPQIVASAATADSALALESLDALAITGAGTVLPGHGEPWLEGIDSAVAEARRRGAS